MFRAVRSLSVSHWACGRGPGRIRGRPAGVPKGSGTSRRRSGPIQKPYLTSIESPHFLLCFGMGFGGLKGALASLLAARATCALFTLLNGSSHRERALLGSWVRCHVPLLLLITLLTRIIHHLSLHVMPRAPPSLRHHPLGQKHPPTHCQ